MLKRLLKFVLKNDIGIRVRGGWRLQSALCRASRSVPIRISGYPPLYIDMLTANWQGFELLRDEPYADIPHEKQIQSLARRLIRPGDVVFDVGANYGLHTLLFSRLAGDAGRVIAFEPNAFLAPPLRRTISRLANTRLLECALSDEKGTATLHVPEDHSMGSLRDWRGGGCSYQCRTELLDELVSSGIVPPPNFVKVDVEGAEALVFRGARRTLQTSRPIVVFEELKMAAERFRYGQHSAAEFIQSLPGERYRLYLAFEEGIVPLPEDRRAWCDIVAIPEERIPDAVPLIVPNTFEPPAGRRS